MASNETYVSDKELTELYDSLDKESLIKLLVKKYRESEKNHKKIVFDTPSSKS